MAFFWIVRQRVVCHQDHRSWDARSGWAALGQRLRPFSKWSGEQEGLRSDAEVQFFLQVAILDVEWRVRPYAQGCFKKAMDHFLHQWIGLREKFNRKAQYLMGKSMVSCRFSLKQIHFLQSLAHWQIGFWGWALGRLLQRGHCCPRQIDMWIFTRSIQSQAENKLRKKRP